MLFQINTDKKQRLYLPFTESMKRQDWVSHFTISGWKLHNLAYTLPRAAAGSLLHHVRIVGSQITPKTSLVEL